jgi:hypothetical protein
VPKFRWWPVKTAKPTQPPVRRGPTVPAVPGGWLEQFDPEAWAVLTQLWKQPLTDVDRARISQALNIAAGNETLAPRIAGDLLRRRELAALHRSGQRDLPTERTTAHNLDAGQVLLGQVVPDHRNVPAMAAGPFGLDHDVLRTSMVVVGPPGTGKTFSFALPIVEHLALSALANKVSLVVVDPKGDDFAREGWFDVTIDLGNPSYGFSLYGGAANADEAADRLASALLPPKVSDDRAYFTDASRNAIYACLAPFREAYGRWPTVEEMLRLLRADAELVADVEDRLTDHPEARHLRELLAQRRRQTESTSDPAAGAVERFGLLDRPALRRLFDHPARTFTMREINQPVRVRVVLPEGQYPDASRVLARLVVSQFVQVVSAPDINRGIFKCLVVDEASRFVDEYVARGVQRVRSNNGGLVLLAQSLGDFPPDLARTIFGSAGCKAVFGGGHPGDAELFSQFWGEQVRYETTVSFSESRSSRTDSSGSASGGEQTAGRSMSVRRVDQARWSVSDLVTQVAPGQCVVSLTRSDGQRVGPVLIDLRQR